MALSASSRLFYLDTQYDIRAHVGGEPHFSRNGEAWIQERSGIVRPRPVNTPRFGWNTMFDPQRIAASDRRSTLLLEMARTNALTFPSDFTNAAWVKTTTTVTPGRLDPAGATAACTLTATAANAEVRQTLSAGASIVRTNSLWMRRRTGVGEVRLWGPDAVDYIIPILTPEWRRFTETDGAASTSRVLIVSIVANGDEVDVWHAQQDDGAFATSEAEGTRTTDLLYYDYNHAPQAAMHYVRFVESGSIANENSVIFNIPLLRIYRTSAGYTGYHHNGSAERITTALAAPAIGDTVELLLILFADGSVQLVQSINGAAVTSTAATAASALGAAWSGTRLWINSFDETQLIGANRFAELKFVKYADVVGATAQARMEELRAFEFSGSDQLLSA